LAHDNSEFAIDLGQADLALQALFRRQIIKNSGEVLLRVVPRVLLDAPNAVLVVPMLPLPVPLVMGMTLIIIIVLAFFPGQGRSSMLSRSATLLDLVTFVTLA
jgi:uncharacterized membrane protein